MTIKLYGYIPAWGLPCISPYVTKVANYCTMTGVDYEMAMQDLTALDKDSPNGKLPRIEDDDGKIVWDSTRIVEHLAAKHGHTIDDGLSAADKSAGVAFQRLVEENLYWSGVIQPRWREDSGWHTYIPYILAQGDKSYDEVWASLDDGTRGFLDDFRLRILKGFDGQGMGRRSAEEVVSFYRDDIDALSNFLGDKPFFLGDEPRTVDASIYSSLRHVIDQPQIWAGSDYAKGKPNLMAYITRMRDRFGI
jgi:isoprene-epoxide---glutathione S-transferase